MNAENPRSDIKLSFEFFPPKSEEMAIQLWKTVDALKSWGADFMSVTYGAGGTTRDTTLATVARLIGQCNVPAAAHMTCVGATQAEVAQVVNDFRRVGTRHFVALRGDPVGGAGTSYQPHPGGYANAAELTAGIARLGDFEISVSAYPEKHPESATVSADIDMLKRKVDNGATRALTQFFFDNNQFEAYLEQVRAAGIDVPVVPGLLPIQNLAQVKRFASACGASVPGFVENRLAPHEDNPESHAKAAADLASEQMRDLMARGISEFHFYTMNRSALVNTVLKQAGITCGVMAHAGSAA